MTEFKEWVSKVTSHASTREIGRRIDMNHVTVSRHINSASVQFCIDLANAYDTNPIPGLLAAGAITEHQIDEYSRSHDLSDYSDLELAQEIVNRLQDTADHQELTTPTDELSARRKSNRTTPGVADDGYRDDMPDDAVAYGHDEVGGTPDDFEP